MLKKVYVDIDKFSINKESIFFEGLTTDEILEKLVKLLDDRLVIINNQETAFDKLVKLNNETFDLQKRLQEDFNIKNIVIKEEVDDQYLEDVFEQEFQKQKWIVSYFDINKSKSENSIETLLTLGNGYFASRGKPNEDGSYYGATYIAGLYNKVKTHIAGREIFNEDFVNVGSLFDYEIEINDTKLDLEESAIDIRRDLNLLDGTLNTTILWNLNGKITEIKSIKLVSQKNKHLALLKYEITPINHKENIKIIRYYDSNVVNDGVERYRDLTNKHLDKKEFKVNETKGGAYHKVVYLTTESKINVEIVNNIRTLSSYDNKLLKAYEDTTSLTYDFSFKNNQKIELVQETLISSSNIEKDDNYDEYLKFDFDFTKEYKKSASVWKKIWNEYNIKLKGNLLLEKALKLNSFHMHASYSENTIGIDASVPARGLHGEAYRGHIFWDDIFISPYYLHHDPKIAKNMLLYRYNRLEAARQNAKTSGYKGAMFPWQSGRLGDEQTQTLHLNPVDNTWGDDYSILQRHVSLAVAYDIIRYFEETNDIDFLLNYGYEILIEVARFFSSLVFKNEITNKYETKGIMGPDEFHEQYPNSNIGGINNNAYTNVLLSWFLTKLINLHDVYKKNNAEVVKNIDIKFKVTGEEILKWKDISHNLTINIENGILEQYDDFFKLKDIDFEAYKQKYGNIYRLDRIFKSENKNINEYKVNKQADTMMLFFLFNNKELKEIFSKLGFNDFDEDFANKNFDYYLNITTHGSTLSRITYASIALKLGRTELANDLFINAAISDYIDIQGGTTAEGIHTGVMASTIIEMYKAYAGIDFEQENINVKPSLPSSWDQLRFKVNFKLNKYDINIEKGDVEKTLISNKQLGVLFDLDGVITDTAKYHFIAWKQIASSLGIEIDEQFNERLKGVSREESLNRILEYGKVNLGESDKEKYMSLKNDHYIDLLSDLTSKDILPGIENLFIDLKENNHKIAIASASKNAPRIVEKLGIEEYIDAIANPEVIEASKPAPDIFLEAARLIEIPLENTIGIEDAQSGIEAINSANIISIGIGENLNQATQKLKSTKELTYSKLIEIFSKNQKN